jgi:hypothetical protein
MAVPSLCDSAYEALAGPLEEQSVRYLWMAFLMDDDILDG